MATTIQERADKYLDEVFEGWESPDILEMSKEAYIKGAIDQHEREMGRLNDVLNALMIDTRDKCKILELMEK